MLRLPATMERDAELRRQSTAVCRLRDVSLKDRRDEVNPSELIHLLKAPRRKLCGCRPEPDAEIIPTHPDTRIHFIVIWTCRFSGRSGEYRAHLVLNYAVHFCTVAELRQDARDVLG